MLPVLTEQHVLEFRVFLNPLVNLATMTGLTVTTGPTASINSASLILKMTRLPPAQLQKEITLLKTPRHYRFHDYKPIGATALSGTSSITIPLTAVVGKVAGIFFVCRPTASQTLDNAFSFTDIASFAVFSGGAENIVGGQLLTSLFNRTIQAQHWNRSFYLYDAFNGTSNAFVFQYFWSHNPFEAINHGRSLSYRQFTGTETLSINFTGTLGANLDITGYAITEAYVQQDMTSSRKIYA
jgi:hypothetical protein